MIALRGLIGCLLLWLIAMPVQAAETPTPAMDVMVLKKADRWTADFTFNKKARAWVFRRSGLTYDSHKPWRAQSWMVETPGVMLQRHGHYDVLVSTTGKAIPKKTRISFTPFARVLLGDYDPALSFTDGSIALFSQQFEAFPYDDVAAIAGFSTDLNTITANQVNVRTRMKDSAGPLLYLGQRFNSVEITGGGGGGYIVFGPISPVETPSMSMIVDPQLPVWIGGTLRRAVPKIIDGYAEALGPPPGSRPTIMVSWAGPKKNVRSMSGSVLPDLVIMTFEGEAMLAESDNERHHALWFIAHESAHFWLGNQIHEETTRDRWIFEGGSDLLAFRSVATSEPSYDWRAAINKSIAECVTLSAGKPIATAQERNEHRAYYTCGAVFGLVAEAASKKPFTVFVRSLIDANRSDKVVTRAEWLAELDRVSGDPSLSRDIGEMIDKGSADPKALIASLFMRAGIVFTLDESGMPKLI